MKTRPLLFRHHFDPLRIDGSGQTPTLPTYTLLTQLQVHCFTIGPTGHNITGMAFSPTSSVLYGVSGGK